MKLFYLLIMLSISSGLATEVKQPGTDVFKARRAALMEMLDGRVAVLYSGEAQVGGVVEELFIQESSFYYLTGVSEPADALIVEPGIYLTEEGIGIRIEDVVLVTEDGPIVLSRHIPRTVEEIERTMAR